MDITNGGPYMCTYMDITNGVHLHNTALCGNLLSQTSVSAHVHVRVRVFVARTRVLVRMHVHVLVRVGGGI